MKNAYLFLIVGLLIAGSVFLFNTIQEEDEFDICENMENNIKYLPQGYNDNFYNEESARFHDKIKLNIIEDCR